VHELFNSERWLCYNISTCRPIVTLIPDEEIGSIPENLESFLDTVELEDKPSPVLVTAIMNNLYALTILVYLTQLRSCGIKSEKDNKFELERTWRND
jgi:hypothetical protein